MTLLMSHDEARKNEAMRLEFQSRLHLDFGTAILTCGDFAAMDGPIGLGVERKTLNNLIFSILNNELDEQLSRMVDTYDMPVLLVEGFPLPDVDGKVEVFGASKHIPYGLLIATVAGWWTRGVFPIFLKNVQGTVRTVIDLYRYCSKGDHRRNFAPRKLSGNMRPLSVRDQMLIQLPGMGPAALKKIDSTLDMAGLAGWSEQEWQDQVGKSLGAKAYAALRSSK